MQIRTNYRTIEGEHNGISFQLEGGILHIGGLRFVKKSIKTLVELANLLELEGYPLEDSFKQPNPNPYLGNWLREEENHE